MASNALPYLSTCRHCWLGLVLHARKTLFYFNDVICLGASRHLVVSHPQDHQRTHTHNVSAGHVHLISEANAASDRTDIMSKKEYRWRAIFISVLLAGIGFVLEKSLSYFCTIICLRASRHFPQDHHRIHKQEACAMDVHASTKLNVYSF